MRKLCASFNNQLKLPAGSGFLPCFWPNGGNSIQHMLDKLKPAPIDMDVVVDYEHLPVSGDAKIKAFGDTIKELKRLGRPASRIHTCGVYPFHPFEMMGFSGEAMREPSEKNWQIMLDHYEKLKNSVYREIGSVDISLYLSNGPNRVQPYGPSIKTDLLWVTQQVNYLSILGDFPLTAWAYDRYTVKDDHPRGPLPPFVSDADLATLALWAKDRLHTSIDTFLYWVGYDEKGQWPADPRFLKAF